MMKLIIRDAKGGKDRRVPLPCSLVAPLKAQIDRARKAWEWDRAHAPSVGVTLPHRLAVKYPSAPRSWQWFWVFPAAGHCNHPRTGELEIEAARPKNREILRSAFAVGVMGDEDLRGKCQEVMTVPEVPSAERIGPRKMKLSPYDAKYDSCAWRCSRRWIVGSPRAPVLPKSGAFLVTSANRVLYWRTAGPVSTACAPPRGESAAVPPLNAL